jgi:transcriptional regulator with XRE-family HTH domain
MDIRDLVKKKVQEGEKQVDIARKAGISQGTIYKLLYTETKPTLDIIVKLANAYHLPVSEFVAEGDAPQWDKTAGRGLSKKEEQLLSAFSQLDDRRQERIMESIEDMLLALRESQGREGQEKESKGLNSERKSNG